MEFFMMKYNVFNTISADFISNLSAENAISKRSEELNKQNF